MYSSLCSVAIFQFAAGHRMSPTSLSDWLLSANCMEKKPFWKHTEMDSVFLEKIMCKS